MGWKSPWTQDFIGMHISEVLVLFNIFVSDLLRGAESKLIKFLDGRDDQNIREQQ